MHVQLTTIILYYIFFNMLTVTFTVSRNTENIYTIIELMLRKIYFCRHQRDLEVISPEII